MSAGSRPCFLHSGHGNSSVLEQPENAQAADTFECVNINSQMVGAISSGIKRFQRV